MAEVAHAGEAKKRRFAVPLEFSYEPDRTFQPLGTIPTPPSSPGQPESPHANQPVTLVAILALADLSLDPFGLVQRSSDTTMVHGPDRSSGVTTLLRLSGPLIVVLPRKPRVNSQQTREPGMGLGLVPVGGTRIVIGQEIVVAVLKGGTRSPFWKEMGSGARICTKPGPFPMRLVAGSRRVMPWLRCLQTPSVGQNAVLK